MSRCRLSYYEVSALKKLRTNDGGDAQSLACCGEAFMPAEVGYQDEESDEWTTDTDDVEIVRDLYEQWSSHFDEVLSVFEKENLKEREEWLWSFHTD